MPALRFNEARKEILHFRVHRRERRRRGTELLGRAEFVRDVWHRAAA